MSEAELADHIRSLGDVHAVVADGNTFFFVGDERSFPFATIVASDAYDQVSDLARDGVFRLNLGVDKATFQALFPSADAGHDFTALDRVMPHPVYGKMYWVCVLNPTTTIALVRSLVAEAHAKAQSSKTKR